LTRSRRKPTLHGLSRRFIAALVLLSIGIGALWVATPSGADLQQRVEALVRGRQARLLEASEVPNLLTQAVIATEDERFYANHGIDALGLARSLLYDASQGCLCEGGSTITEQLVKIVYLDGTDAGLHKPADIGLALKIGLTVGKGTILADYLSVIPTGRGLYGVEEAACVYFDRPVSELDLGGFALIAGMAQAPSLDDPRFDLEAAVERRAHVLAAMRREGYITDRQERETAAQAVMLASRSPESCTANR
jgi:penicillin-binding protein 1A